MKKKILNFNKRNYNNNFLKNYQKVYPKQFQLLFLNHFKRNLQKDYLIKDLICQKKK